MHLQFYKTISFFQGSVTRRLPGPSDQHCLNLRLRCIVVLYLSIFFRLGPVYEKGKRRNGLSQ